MNRLIEMTNTGSHDLRGSWTISGTLSKNDGSFKIKHPLPEKNKTHYLVHSFIEGPQADLFYSGMIILGNDGKAIINIDDQFKMTRGTFEMLTCNRRHFTKNESGFTLVKSNLNGNELTITAQDPTCRDTFFGK